MIKLSATQAAAEFGIARGTIRKALVNAGIFKDGAHYTIRDIYELLSATEKLKLAKIRREEAEAEAIERENAEADGRLHDRSVIEKTVWGEILGPLKMELELMPEKLANLVNPENPVSAHKVLTKAVEEIKKQIADVKGK